MLGSDMLEVAIGLVFVYLLMSLAATAAREMLETWLKARGRFLEQGLIEMFKHGCKPDELNIFLTKFYSSPLIFSLYRGEYHPPPVKPAAGTAVTPAPARAVVAPGGAAPAVVPLPQTPAPTPVNPAARSKSVGQLPSYIPSSNFANAIFGLAESYLRPGTGGQPLSFDRLTAAAWAVPNLPVQRMLLQALDSAKGDLDQARLFLENWYDGSMDRVSGWYRRHTQVIVFFAGLVLCVVLNVNTMVIGHALHESAALRQAVSATAADFAKAPPAGVVTPPAPTAPVATPSPQAGAGQTGAGQTDVGTDGGMPPGSVTSSGDADTPLKRFNASLAPFENLELPIGWGSSVRRVMAERISGGVAQEISGGFELGLGWLLTALAITLGAPFWFDVLNNIMVIRSTVKPTEKSPDEPSKDGRGAAAASTLPAGQQQQQPPPTPPLSDDTAGAHEIAALDPASRPREEHVEDGPEPGTP